MATPSFRQRAGRIDIQNKERALKELSKKENRKEESISEEEHQRRLLILKQIGVLKENGKTE